VQNAEIVKKCELVRESMQKFDDISGPFFGGGVGGVKVFLSTALPVSKRPKVVCVCVRV
jgi:hypothetical protein